MKKDLKIIKWLFFDIGSTLVDERECYRRRILEMTEGTDVTYNVFYEEMLSFYKQGKKGDKRAAEKHCFRIPKWRSEYENLYPDAEECLERLSKKYRLGIIGNQNPGTKDRLRIFGIDSYFDVIVSSSEEGVEKPDLAIFLLALKRANCSPEQAVMIGDRLDNDIAPANRLGMLTVRIMRGFGQYATAKNAGEKADYIINNLNELCKLLL